MSGSDTALSMRTVNRCITLEHFRRRRAHSQSVAPPIPMRSLAYIAALQKTMPGPSIDQA